MLASWSRSLTFMLDPLTCTSVTTKRPPRLATCHCSSAGLPWPFLAGHDRSSRRRVPACCAAPPVAVRRLCSRSAVPGSTTRAARRRLPDRRCSSRRRSRPGLRRRSRRRSRHRRYPRRAVRRAARPFPGRAAASPGGLLPPSVRPRFRCWKFLVARARHPSNRVDRRGSPTKLTPDVSPTVIAPVTRM